MAHEYNTKSSSLENSVEKEPYTVANVASLDTPYSEDGEITSRGESLHRGLSSRQVTMIAIGGAIGTGLIIGTYV